MSTIGHVGSGYAAHPVLPGYNQIERFPHPDGCPGALKAGTRPVVPASRPVELVQWTVLYACRTAIAAQMTASGSTHNAARFIRSRTGTWAAVIAPVSVFRTSDAS